MDDERKRRAEPLCAVCGQPVHDDAERGFVRAPGAGQRFGRFQVMYHHQACERDGRSFLALS